MATNYVQQYACLPEDYFSFIYKREHILITKYKQKHNQSAIEPKNKHQYQQQSKSETSNFLINNHCQEFKQSSYSSTFS